MSRNRTYDIYKSDVEHYGHVPQNKHDNTFKNNTNCTISKNSFATFNANLFSTFNARKIVTLGIFVAIKTNNCYQSKSILFYMPKS